MPRVGDVIEFQHSGYPPPPQEWVPERIKEIRVVEEYDDKEGQTVSRISWRDIREYHSLVIILGETVWARNDQVRPVRRAETRTKKKFGITVYDEDAHPVWTGLVEASSIARAKAIAMNAYLRTLTAIFDEEAS